MKLFQTALAASLLGAGACGHAQPNPAGPPQATLAAGRIEGARSGDIVSYKGIPYAAPPLGELRWRAPQPVSSWNSARDATSYGDICPQTYNASDDGVGPLPMSEDCLTLNVFAPESAKAEPVMVWIHGGGFVNGSGTAALYDGTELARQGVVVVTLNYRLGRLGFFAHPSLTAEASGEPVGNYALMDMIQALEWVRDNITAFGGDPKRVTIFGESAGGVAVNDLMVSPAARGLFVGAISQSGLGREAALPLAEAEQLGVKFAADLGLTNPGAADLRRVPADQIIQAGDPDLRTGAGSMLDGRILNVGPLEGFRNGRQAPVPYLAGFNSLEFPVPEAQVELMLAGTLSAPDRERLVDAYGDRTTFLTHVVSDLIFNEPSLALATLHASRGFPTWVYQFSVVPDSMKDRLKGAPHATERKYVFNTLQTSAWPTDAADEAQAETMSAYWAAFAKAGDPNGGARPQWPMYDPAADAILDFTNNGAVAIKSPRRAAMDVLASIANSGGDAKR